MNFNISRAFWTSESEVRIHGALDGEQFAEFAIMNGLIMKLSCESHILHPKIVTTVLWQYTLKIELNLNCIVNYWQDTHRVHAVNLWHSPR